MVIVVFEPQKPVLHDEYGVPIFAGGDIFFVVNWTIKSDKIHITTIEVFPRTPCFASLESAERWIKENKPKQPIYVDPENGDEFFKGMDCYFFNKELLSIEHTIFMDLLQIEDTAMSSKLYNTREKCEIGLAKFLANKNGYVLEDRNFKGIKNE